MSLVTSPKPVLKIPSQSENMNDYNGNTRDRGRTASEISLSPQVSRLVLVDQWQSPGAKLLRNVSQPNLPSPSPVNSSQLPLDTVGDKSEDFSYYGSPKSDFGVCGNSGWYWDYSPFKPSSRNSSLAHEGPKGPIADISVDAPSLAQRSETVSKSWHALVLLTDFLFCLA